MMMEMQRMNGGGGRQANVVSCTNKAGAGARKERFDSPRLLLHKWWCARHKQSCAIGWMELGDLDWSRAEQARLLPALLPVGAVGRCSCRASKE